MARRIPDTSILIAHWHRRKNRLRRTATTKDVKRWAKEIIDLYETDRIVTPVYLELVAGVASKQELELAEAFLGEFTCLDGGNIPEDDWREALRLAKRVPKDGKPRHLGDCLIQAIANRFGCDVITRDKTFPSR